VKLTHVELRRLALPLVIPFRTSWGVETARDVLLVRVLGPDGEGWGECVAMSEPLYTAEYVDGAEQVIERYLLPRLAPGGEVLAADVPGRLAPVQGHPMAKAALEAALLDAELRAAGTPLARHLGAERTMVPSGVAVGIHASAEATVDAVGAYLDEGYLRVKLKIEPGWDVQPVRAVRERFGDDVLLQVDANAAYSLADADRLAALDPFGLLLIEQPLAVDDIAGHAALASLVLTPICLDESITSARSAADAIARGACTVVNIKPGRVGGLAEAVRIHDLCRDAGVAVWCGGMLETGIGRAMNVALAALPGFTIPGDLSASARYFHRDVTDPFVLEHGHLRVPTAPGIGVSPLPDALAELTTSVRTVALG
jgi:o-succinylbenzoate synthase